MAPPTSALQILAPAFAPEREPQIRPMTEAEIERLTLGTPPPLGATPLQQAMKAERPLELSPFTVPLVAPQISREPSIQPGELDLGALLGRQARLEPRAPLPGPVTGKTLPAPGPLLEGEISPPLGDPLAPSGIPSIEGIQPGELTPEFRGLLEPTQALAPSPTVEGPSEGAFKVRDFLGLERFPAGLIGEAGLASKRYEEARRKHLELGVKERGLVEQQAALAQKKLTAETTAREKRARQIEGASGVYKDAKEAFREERELRRAKMDEALEGIRDFKVDPDRYWKNASTGQKITSAIAIVLGGLGQGLVGGGRNFAADIIEKAVDRDIEAQHSELAKRTGELSIQQNLLGLSRQSFLDDKEAFTFAKVMAYEAAQRKIDEVAAQYGGEDIRLRAEDFKNQLQRRQASHLDTMQQAWTKTFSELWGKAGQMSMRMNDLQMRAKEIVRKASVAAKGVSGPLAVKIGGQQAVIKLLKGMKADWDKSGSNFGFDWVLGFMPGSQAKTYKESIPILAMTLVEFIQDRMSNEDYQVMMDILPGPGITKNVAHKIFDTFIEMAENNIEASTGALGAAGFEVRSLQDRLLVAGIPSEMILQ